MLLTKRSIYLLCILSLVLGMMLVLGWQTAIPSYAADKATAARADRGALLNIQNAFTSIADEIKPAVVFITAERTTTSNISSPGFPDIEELFRNFPFGGPSIPTPRGGTPQPARSSGSGVIVRSDGYILTNDHVVAGAEKVKVRLDDGREFTGTVMRDPRTDLAVVKIDAANLPAAKIADSDNVKVGQWAIAIGSPFGLTNSLTVGVVSAVTRAAAIPDPNMPDGVRRYPDLIQTDASINPGNSGGPLVNIDGEVIGINTMIESPTGANAGIGFAVPANTAKYVMDQLIAHGKVDWGQLGVEITDISPNAAKTLGVDKGAIVNHVLPGSPADDAGIKPMDIIVDVNGKQITDSLSLRRVIERIKPGTTVPVIVVRDGNRQTLKVTVGKADDILASSPTGTKAKLGMVVQELTADRARQLEVPAGTKGVMVQSIEPRSPASRAQPQIVPGDVILKINSQPITSVAEFNRKINALKSGDTALILIQRKDRTLISELTVD